MGLFELFRKQNNNPALETTYQTFDDSTSEESDTYNMSDESNEIVVENGKNEQMLLTVKFFFENMPTINKNIFTDALEKKYRSINIKENNNLVSISLNEFDTENSEDNFECCILTTDDLLMQPLPQEVFRQNWHWKQAGSIAQKCNYEILLTESKLTGLNYKQRTEVFIDFVSACIEATNPIVIYSKNAEKLLDPIEVLACNSEVDPDILHPLTNIRMFKIADSENGEILMDTVGLSSLGLPDFEIIFNNQNPAKVAELLLRYCYFIYDIGDNILHGEYVEGLQSDEKYRCDKRKSLLPPERIVLHVLIS